jgi:hypothetical protein
MPVEMVSLGFAPKGRETIRRRKGAGSLPGDPMQPDPPLSRVVGLRTFDPKPDTTLAKLEAAYLGALGAVDEAEAHRSKAMASGKFTDAGVNTQVLQFAASTLSPKLYRYRQTIDEAREEAKEQREKLTLPAADKTDAAGQMRRLWKLDKFNAMPSNERNTFIAKNLGRLDPELVQAFLEAPEYSQLLPSDLAQIRERALREQHGDDAVDELEEFDRGIALADRAVRMAREELAIEAGVDLAKFNEAARPYENAPAPWLRKCWENGKEVVRVARFNADPRTGGTLSIPTEEELQTGKFYKDIHEYRKAHGLSDAA